MPKPPLPPEKYKSKKAEIRMTESEYEDLKRMAKDQKMSISRFVRALINFVNVKKTTQ